MLPIELSPPMPGKNKYIVWNPETNVFDEFPVKLGTTQVGNFLEMAMAPPVIRAGFLSYKKQIFYISTHDLLRSHVNVTRPYTCNTQSNSTAVREQSTENTDQLGSKSSSRDELDTESDIYWQEQMQSLLNSTD